MTDDDLKEFIHGDNYHAEYGPFCYCDRASPANVLLVRLRPDTLPMYCHRCGNDWDAFARTEAAPTYNDGTRPEELR